MQTETPVLSGTRTFASSHSTTATSDGSRRLRPPADDLSTSGVPFRKAKSKPRAYVNTALAWRDAGTAVPFAIVSLNDGCVIGSTRFWNIERWAWPAGHARHGRNYPDACEIGYTWLAPLGHPHRSQHRSQTADARPRLRNLAGASRLLSHRRAQPALPRRPRTHRRKVRRHSAVPTAWPPTTFPATLFAIRSWPQNGPDVKATV